MRTALGVGIEMEITPGVPFLEDALRQADGSDFISGDNDPMNIETSSIPESEAIFFIGDTRGKEVIDLHCQIPKGRADTEQRSPSDDIRPPRENPTNHNRSG